ncbi:hypothetical protein DFH29DRAFT_546517 [Suillus ampliporus]|nr:hypothetical protein DFH29DRAFT_546517 [Suillus ampliporus]
MHLNDSKAALGSRHEYIGLGQLGISVFRHIVSDSRTQNIPLILETLTFEATEVWTKEISTLNCLPELVDDGKVSETELSLVNEITSLVRSRATSKVGEASNTHACKRDVTEEHEHGSGCS